MESIPYDKRTGKFGLMAKPLIGPMQTYIFKPRTTLCKLFLKERVYDGEIFKLKSILKDFLAAKRMGIKVPYSQKR